MQMTLTREDVVPTAHRASKVMCVSSSVHDTTEPMSMTSHTTWTNYTDNTLYIVHRDGVIYSIPPVFNRDNVKYRDFHGALIASHEHARAKFRGSNDVATYAQRRNRYAQQHPTDLHNAVDLHLKASNEYTLQRDTQLRNSIGYVFRYEDIAEDPNGHYCDQLDVTICTDPDKASRVIHPYSEFARTVQIVGHPRYARRDPFVTPRECPNEPHAKHVYDPVGFSFRIAIISRKEALRDRYMNVAGVVVKIPVLRDAYPGAPDGVYIGSSHRSLKTGLDAIRQADGDVPGYIRYDLEEGLEVLKLYDNVEEAEKDGLLSDNLVKLRTIENSLEKLDLEKDRIAADNRRLKFDIERLERDREVAREEAERKKEQHRQELEKQQQEHERREKAHQLEMDRRAELHQQELEKNEQKARAEALQAKQRHRSDVTKLITGFIGLVGAAFGLMKAFA